MAKILLYLRELSCYSTELSFLSLCMIQRTKLTIVRIQHEHTGLVLELQEVLC